MFEFESKPMALDWLSSTTQDVAAGHTTQVSNRTARAVAGEVRWQCLAQQWTRVIRLIEQAGKPINDFDQVFVPLTASSGTQVHLTCGVSAMMRA